MSKKKKIKNNTPRIPQKNKTFRPIIGVANTTENMKKWVDNLNPIEIEFLKMYADEFYKPFILSFDCCITATLFQEFEDMTLEQVCKFQDELMKNLNEHVECERKLIKKGIDTVANKDKMQIEVQMEVEKMLAKGVKNQKKAIEDLKMKFPTLSIASLTNCFKKVKEINKSKLEINEELVEKIKKQAAEDDVKKALDYIFEDKKEESEAVEIRKEEIKEIAERVDTLRVVSKQIVIEGMYGQYVKTESGVTHKDEYWTSANAVKERTVIEVEKINKEIELLKEKLEELENNKDNVTELALELEQVFQM